MNAVNIAKYTINFSNALGHPLTHLKLQLVLYLLNGEYHQKTSVWLIDNFIATATGPMNKEVQRIYCGYGIAPIFSNSQLSQRDMSFDDNLVNAILQRIVQVPTRTLFAECCEEGKAWNKTFTRYGGNAAISKAWIWEDFRMNKH